MTKRSGNGKMDMTQGNIVKQVLLFSVPLLIGNLLQELYNIVDSIVVGNFVSTNALAAVGSSGVLIRLIVGLFVGISTGSSVVIAQYYGAKDQEKLEKAVHTAMAVTLIGGIALIVLGLIFTRPLLIAMNTPEEVLPDAVTYLRIFFTGSVFAAMYNMGSGILRGVGDSKRPLYYLCASTVTNIIGDLVLVAWFRMGVVGVALATIASQAVSAVLVLRAMVRTDEIYKVTLSKVRIHGESMKKILLYGIPSGIQGIIVSVSNVLVQTTINGFGASAVAGYSAYLKIDGILSMAIMSFGMAAMTFTGQNYGACKYDRVREGVKKTILIGEVYTAAAVTLMLLFGKYLLRMFTQDAEVIGYGVTMMHIIVIGYFGLAIAQILAGIFRGAGKSMTSMLFLVGNFVGVRLLWVMIIGHWKNTFETVICGYPISWITAAVMMLVYLWKGPWLERRDMPAGGPAGAAEKD